METNLEKYKDDIQKLIKEGKKLLSILRSDDDLKKFRKILSSLVFRIFSINKNCFTRHG